MFKDLLIVFFSCLLITAAVNGSQRGSEAPATATSTTDPGTEVATEIADATSTAADTSDETFEDDVLNSPIPVLVDFSISGCAPCKRMAPVIDSLAREYDGKLKIVKLDANINSATKEKYSVSAFPTFIIFSHGQPVARNTGAMDKTELASILDRQIAQSKEGEPIVPNEEKVVE